MKYLCIVNTYYQLLFCIQMRLTILNNVYMTILISDHSKNANQIAEIIKEKKIFNEVHYIRTRDIDVNIGIKQKIIDCVKLSGYNETRYDYLFDVVENKYYDMFLFYNLGYLYIDACYSYFWRFNKNLKISLFEEGILAYSIDYYSLRRRKLVDYLKRIKGKPPIVNQIVSYYCFYPVLFKGNFNVKQVPLISQGASISRVLQDIFKINLQYKQKYIFFTSVYDFEGGKPVGEFELVNKIANLVGKDNLLIKTHPRDTRTIYQDNGFYVDQNSSIPWEAIQLSGDFSDKVFMTINSGSVLSGSTMSEKPVRTYYMYKLCDISGNLPCQKNARDIENLLDNESMREVLRMVHIA